MQRPHELMTLAAVARELGVSSHTVSKWIEADCLRSVRPNGGRRYVLRADFDSFISELKFGEKSEVSEVSKADN